MTEQAQAHMEESARRRVARGASTVPERFLLALGADPEFIAAVFGDLAEEYARRCVVDGARVAAAWRARELVRSIPHLLRSALRHGGPRAYARLAAAAALIALSLGVLGVAVLTRDGAPARLLAGPAGALDGIVVNKTRPVQLQMQVLDNAGHTLNADSVRFEWVSGAPLAISPLGVLACSGRGDATVRASLGAISTLVDVHCRPVREIRATTWIDFLAGDTMPRHLPFVAIGVDGLPVTELRGAARVFDASVATLEGASVRPKAAGQTAVVIEVGEQEARMMVVVHEVVRTFDHLRDDQRNVARRVRLARGDTVQWALPNGSFWLKYLPRHAGDAPPTITVAGEIGCSPGDGIRVYRMSLGEYGTYCFVQRGGSASVVVAHGATGAEWVEGTMAIERVQAR